MHVLETERLRLRHLDAGDAEFMLELLNEPSYIHQIGDKGVRSLADAREFILHQITPSYRKHGFGLYMVEMKQSGAALGICGLVKRDGLEDIDIGYAFLQRFWARGYAFESSAAIMHYAQNSVGLPRIAAITAPDNSSSIGLLNKLGMKFDKMIKLCGRDSKLFIKPFVDGGAQ